jgi:hypothetical protein
MTGYWNEKIIQNERDCFQTRAAATADLEAQGRFKKQNATQVIGTAVPTYPHQSPTSPWGGEPPIPVGGDLDYFGTDISAVEPVLNEPTPDPETGQHLPVSDVVGSGPATDGIAAGRGGSRQQSPSASSQPSRSRFRRRF